ncbi:MAG: hypothetical protein V5A68_07750, partial [Candidatus Thermoplasmatota archaeon]
IVKRIDPDFPALKETFREIMEDSMDIDNAEKYLKKIQEEKIDIEILRGHVPSPFSFNLMTLGASDIVLMEDKKKFTMEMHKEVMEAIKHEI